MGVSRFLVLLKTLPSIRCKELHSRFNSDAKSKAQGTQPTARTPTAPEPKHSRKSQEEHKVPGHSQSCHGGSSAADKPVAGSLITHLEMTC